MGRLSDERRISPVSAAVAQARKSARYASDDWPVNSTVTMSANNGAAMDVDRNAAAPSNAKSASGMPGAMGWTTTPTR